MNIPIAGTLPSHEINSFSNSTVFRPDLYIPTQCQVIRSSATWSAGIGEVDGKKQTDWLYILIGPVIRLAVIKYFRLNSKNIYWSHWKRWAVHLHWKSVFCHVNWSVSNWCPGNLTLGVIFFLNHSFLFWISAWFFTWKTVEIKDSDQVMLLSFLIALGSKGKKSEFKVHFRSNFFDEKLHTKMACTNEVKARS